MDDLNEGTPIEPGATPAPIEDVAPSWEHEPGNPGDDAPATLLSDADAAELLNADTLQRLHEQVQSLADVLVTGYSHLATSHAHEPLSCDTCQGVLARLSGRS